MIKRRKPLRMRHERKHWISRQEDLVLAARLRRLFTRDSPAAENGVYQFPSLYFHTPGGDTLR